MSPKYISRHHSGACQTRFSREKRPKNAQFAPLRGAFVYFSKLYKGFDMVLSKIDCVFPNYWRFFFFFCPAGQCLESKTNVQDMAAGLLQQEALGRAEPQAPQKSPNWQCGGPCQRRTASGGQGCQEQIAAPIAAPVVAAVGVAAAVHM
jgi:hypothetical protein